MFRLSRPVLTYAMLSLAGGATACGGLAPYYPMDTDVDSDSDSDSDTDTDTDTDTLPDLLPLEVTEVDPAHGSTAGGLEVEILGGPFDASAEVYFGDKRATVLNNGTTWLAVEVPNGVEGPSTVRVITDTHAGETEGAFTYWADGEGRIGTYGSFSHTKYLGTYWCIDEDCIQVGTPEPRAGASVAFIEPGNLEYWQNFAPRFNACQSDYEPSLSANVYEPGVSSMTLRLGSTQALNLRQGEGETPSFYYVTSGNAVAGHQAGSTYSLESRGSTSWPAFDMKGAVATPGDFFITSPAVNSDTIPTVRRTSFRVAWNGSNEDYVVIVAGRIGSSGALLEEVSCVVDDTGSFDIPSTVWSGWNLNDQILLQVGRVKEANGVVPFNNARTGMVGVQWVLGAAVTQ